MNERDIFIDALQLDSNAERAAFLQDACGGDAALQQGVEQLLREQQALGSFLEAGPPGMTEAADASEGDLAGRRIGPYKLLEKIGEGGMGAVYMAEQREPVTRRVAVKVIKPGMDSRQVIARFEAERQALAMMDHPNIARVLDAGCTAEGRPFFVMELVRGAPLTEYCDRHKLTPRARLELLLPVCRALQHAHQKGIIHRDLKPSNILVTLYDGRPVPKVIDFGVAKATSQRLTEKTMFTRFGQIVGTLEYMSPEQAELSALDVDTRSDVYSLGVLLYELLTGTTPLSMQQWRDLGLAEMLRMIRETEPERPSTRLSHSGDALRAISAQRRTDPHQLTALVRGELDWIVLRALEKDRARRYESAGALARDIEHYLNDEPVEACPPSAAYRLKKLWKRRRGPVAAAGAVLASLVLGLIASLLLYSQAESSRREADHARAAEAQKGNELQDALDARNQALGEKTRALEEKAAALENSESLRLAALSSAALPENPGRALVLAVESARRDAPRLATQNNALLAALAECREVRTLIATQPEPGNPAIRFTVTSAAFNRGGTKIITTSAGAEPRIHMHGEVRSHFRLNVGLVQVWDVRGVLLASIAAPPHQTFAGADLSPDGRRLVGCFAESSLVSHGESNVRDNWRQCLYSDRVARVWDVASGKEAFVLPGHTQRITAARFSPDGRRIVTSSWDGSLRVWDAATGAPVKVIETGPAALEDAFFSGDGSRLVAFSTGTERGATYADSEKSGETVDEIDPPLDAERGIADVESGDRGSHSRSISFSGAANLPLLGELKLPDAGWTGVRIWDSESFVEIAVKRKDDMPRQSVAKAVALDAAGERAVVGDNRGRVSVIALDDGRERATYATRDAAISALILSPDDQRLLLVFDGGAMSVQHHAEDGRELQSWSGDAWRVRAACFGVRGQHVYAVHNWPPEARPGESPRGEVVILNVDDGEQVGWLKGHEGAVSEVRLSPVGKNVVTASQDGTARLWDADFQPRDATVFPGIGPASSAVFSPDGKQIFVAGGSSYDRNTWEGFGALWNPATGKQLAVLDGRDLAQVAELLKYGVGPTRIAQYSPDGNRLMTVSTDRVARVIPPETPGAELFTEPMEKWPVAAELPHTPVRIWDAKTGRLLFALEGMKCSVAWASFSQDGKQILTLTNRYSNYCYLQTQDGDTQEIATGGNLVHDAGLPLVHLWNAETGELLLTMRDLLNPTHDLGDRLAWRPDGKWIAITELHGVVDLAEQKRYVLPGISSGSEPLFSPDGRFLATRTDRDMTLIDQGALENAKGRHGGELEIRRFAPGGNEKVSRIPSGESRSYRRRRFAGHDDKILSAAFSPDSRWIATTSEDRTVRVWSTQLGELRHVLRGHSGPARQAVFSPDGRYVATVSENVARIWLAETGREFLTLRGHRGPINSITFRPDSRFVLTASDDGSSRLTPVDPLAAAAARRPRELTGDERARFEFPLHASR